VFSGSTYEVHHTRSTSAYWAIPDHVSDRLANSNSRLRIHAEYRVPQLQRVLCGVVVAARFFPPQSAGWRAADRRAPSASITMRVQSDKHCNTRLASAAVAEETGGTLGLWQGRYVAINNTTPVDLSDDVRSAGAGRISLQRGDGYAHGGIPVLRALRVFVDAGEHPAPGRRMTTRSAAHCTGDLFDLSVGSRIVPQRTLQGGFDLTAINVTNKYALYNFCRRSAERTT